MNWETRSQLRDVRYWCSMAATPPSAPDAVVVSGGDMSDPTCDAVLDGACRRARAVVVMASSLLADPDASEHLARKVIAAGERILNADGEVSHAPAQDLIPWKEALKTQRRLFAAGLRETEPRVYLDRRVTVEERGELNAENDRLAQLPRWAA